MSFIKTQSLGILLLLCSTISGVSSSYLRELQSKLNVISENLKQYEEERDREYLNNGNTPKWHKLTNKYVKSLNKYNKIHNKLLKITNSYDQGSETESDN